MKYNSFGGRVQTIDLSNHLQIYSKSKKKAFLNLLVSRETRLHQLFQGRLLFLVVGRSDLLRNNSIYFCIQVGHG